MPARFSDAAPPVRVTRRSSEAAGSAALQVDVAPEATAVAAAVNEVSAPAETAVGELRAQMSVLQEQIATMQDVVLGMSAVAHQQPAVCAAAGDINVVDGAAPMRIGENSRPAGMQTFASVPLGSLVDSKVKAKIWAGQYIELDLLVSEATETPLLVFDARQQQQVGCIIRPIFFKILSDMAVLAIFIFL